MGWITRHQLRLSVLVLAGLCIGSCKKAGVPIQPEPDTDLAWTLLLYLPYDNDLSWAYQTILEQISNASGAGQVGVAIQADLADSAGVTRIALGDWGTTASMLPDESSAASSTFHDFLNWGRQVLPAQNYAIVVLGHASDMPYLAFDSNPGPGGPSWMSVSDLAASIGNWKASTDTNVGLVFLQNCGKGSIENYYELRHAGDYIMSSQASLGAPNSYYEEVLNFLAQSPNATGLELAKAIANSDGSDMFTSYSVIASNQLEELPVRLNRVLAPFNGVEEARAPAVTSITQSRRIETGTSETFEFDAGEGGERVITFDFQGLLSVSATASEGEQLMLRTASPNRSDRILVSFEAGLNHITVTSDSSQLAAELTISMLDPDGLNQCFATNNGLGIDLVEWLRAAYEVNSLDQSLVDSFAAWLRSSLVVHSERSPERLDESENWSGISVFVGDVVDPVAAEFAIYQSTHLDEIFSAMRW